MSEDQGELQPIIVKKIKKGGGHHGGAWKVAYADFVTAMMAFFLLLWLLNVTTDEEKNAISNYFDPTHPKVSQETSGAGGVLGGLSVAPEGAMVSTVQPITAPPQKTSAINNRGQENRKLNQTAVEEAKKTLREAEEARMEDTKAAIEKAISENPELSEMMDNLKIDMTPEGLRIQVIDQEGKPMFASGSARMFAKTKLLLEKVGEIIEGEPNEISVRGHTDSVPYGSGASYTNWELSADRANSSRRVLLDAGYPAERIHDVVGKADTEHLVPENPTDAKNRRISITLLKEEITNPEAFEREAINQVPEDAPETGEDEIYITPTEAAPKRKMPKIGTFRKTPGSVEFP